MITTKYAEKDNANQHCTQSL